MKLSTVFLVLAAIATVTLAMPSGTCSCSMPKTLMSGFDTETTPVFKVKAISILDVLNDAYTWTVMEVKVVFRGCAPSTTQIVVKSPKSVVGCGFHFEPNNTYLATLRKSGSSTPPPSVAAYGLDVYSAVSCNFNKKWDDVPYDDKTNLFYSPVRGCATV